MKFKLLLTFVSVAFLLWVLATAVMAQGEPPPPYAGLKNPFPWSDASAQEAGKKLYQQSCQACHGINGGNIAGADFSNVDFPQSLEEKADFYFWTLSEGRLAKGMPPFKSSLSEEQRWQVLTHLWSLGPATPPEAPPPPPPPVEGEKGALLLTVPEVAQSGQPLTITAALQDEEGKPIGNVPVKFFIKADFFASGLMAIGETLTNAQGIAIFEYTPQQIGETQIVARYEAVEAATTLTLTEADESFYQPETGLHFPEFGQGAFVFPESVLKPGEEGAAPLPVLRIPGGFKSLPLVVYVGAVILVWSLYLYSMYQGFRIPIVKEIRGTDTRLVPLIGMAVMVAFVIMLVLILITGPYSHIHLATP